LHSQNLNTSQCHEIQNRKTPTKQTNLKSSLDSDLHIKLSKIFVHEIELFNQTELFYKKFHCQERKYFDLHTFILLLAAVSATLNHDRILMAPKISHILHAHNLSHECVCIFKIHNTINKIVVGFLFFSLSSQTP
jgi:hypothetical protein